MPACAIVAATRPDLKKDVDDRVTERLAAGPSFTR